MRDVDIYVFFNCLNLMYVGREEEQLAMEGGRGEDGVGPTPPYLCF